VVQDAEEEAKKLPEIKFDNDFYYSVKSICGPNLHCDWFPNATSTQVRMLLLLLVALLLVVLVVAVLVLVLAVMLVLVLALLLVAPLLTPPLLPQVLEAERHVRAALAITGAALRRRCLQLRCMRVKYHQDKVKGPGGGGPSEGQGQGHQREASPSDDEGRVRSLSPASIPVKRSLLANP